MVKISCIPTVFEYRKAAAQLRETQIISDQNSILNTNQTKVNKDNSYKSCFDFDLLKPLSSCFCGDKYCQPSRPVWSQNAKKFCLILFIFHKISNITNREYLRSINVYFRLLCITKLYAQHTRVCVCSLSIINSEHL